MKKLEKILLVDDNKVDNFFHERVIRKFSSNIDIAAHLSGQKALEYLTGLPADELPNLIFLDINMPGMNGWEFLEEYNKLDYIREHCLLVIMLSTSEDPEDKARARKQGIAAEFKSKPLTKEMLTEICDKFQFVPA